MEIIGTQDKLLNVGGNSNNGSLDGLSAANSNNDFSNSNANIGARLTNKEDNNSAAKQPTFLCAFSNHESGEKTFGRVCEGHCVSKPIAEYPIAHDSLKAIRGKNRHIRLSQVYDWENLLKADTIARKGKGNSYGVRKFDRDWWRNMTQLQEELANQTYKTKSPTIEKRMCEHKMRTLAKLSYYDHVAHHALMNICEPVLNKTFYYESSASIKNRGIHYAQKHVRKFLDANYARDMWWTQLDFVKCYHNVVRAKVYDKICKTFRDEGIRRLFKDIIWSLGNHNGLERADGTRGMGIGLYPIQPLVNFYLNDMDRAISKIPDIKYYRYCDNLLIIGFSPKSVWDAVTFVQDYAKNMLEQPLHTNIGIQKYDEVHPVDYVGYVFYPTRTYIRKRTKYTFKRKFNAISDMDHRTGMLSAYKGWLMKCNGLSLWRKITKMKNFSDLKISRTDTMRDGQRFFDVPMVSASFLVNREVVVQDFIANVSTKNGADRMCVLVQENGTDIKFLTNNPRLKDILLQVKELDELPFKATFRSRNLSGGKVEYYFE